MDVDRRKLRTMENVEPSKIKDRRKLLEVNFKRARPPVINFLDPNPGWYLEAHY